MWRMKWNPRWQASTRKNYGKSVAYAEVEGRGVIFLITPGYYLVALDAITGQPIPHPSRNDAPVNPGGGVDGRRGLPGLVHVANRLIRLELGRPFGRLVELGRRTRSRVVAVPSRVQRGVYFG